MISVLSMIRFIFLLTFGKKPNLRINIKKCLNQIIPSKSLSAHLAPLAMIFLISEVAYADIVIKPSFGIGSGEYLEQSYTELKLGGAFHLIEWPLAFQLHGFRRFARQFDDFYGLDLEMKLKRQFKISEQYLFGTFFGPGFRFVSNDFDAPTIDFSLVLSKAQIYSVFLGYKIVMLDWMSNDYKNDSLIYLGIQL